MVSDDLVNSLMVANILNSTECTRLPKSGTVVLEARSAGHAGRTGQVSSPSSAKGRTCTATRCASCVSQVREMGILLKLLSSSEQPWWFLASLAQARPAAANQNHVSHHYKATDIKTNAIILKKKKTHLVIRSAHNKQHTRLDRDLHLKWQHIKPSWWFLKSKYRSKTWWGTSARLTSLNLKTIRKWNL